jgi:hypothetical protein
MTLLVKVLLMAASSVFFVLPAAVLAFARENCDGSCELLAIGANY